MRLPPVLEQRRGRLHQDFPCLQRLPWVPWPGRLPTLLVERLVEQSPG